MKNKRGFLFRVVAGCGTLILPAVIGLGLMLFVLPFSTLHASVEQAAATNTPLRAAEISPGAEAKQQTIPTLPAQGASEAAGGEAPLQAGDVSTVDLSSLYTEVAPGDDMLIEVASKSPGETLDLTVFGNSGQ